MLEACGIDVFKTVRDNGFELSTAKDEDSRWSFFAILLIE